MLILVKSSPETAEARRALRIASVAKAEVVFLQSAVYHAVKDRLKGINLTKVYAIDEDMRMRGIDKCASVEEIGYDALVELMDAHESVTGLY